MSETEWLNIFGDNLSNILKKVGLTRRELAEELGVTEASISNYINSRRFPSVKTIVNIAYVLDCTVDDLVDFGEMIQ